MVDFSRAERAKNHRSSFLKASENVIDFIEQLQTRYKSKWEENEVVRKERAAIIEETIQLLKNKKIKLGKQLGRCNNSELNEELLNAIKSLDDETKEIIQINLIKINNRYEKNIKIGKELESLMDTLSNYRVLEDDYDDEVVITIPKKEVQEEREAVTASPEASTSKDESQDNYDDFINTEELEKVINIKDASDELKSDLNRTLTNKQTSKKQSAKEDDNIHYLTEEDLLNTSDLASIQDELDYITNIELETEMYDESELEEDEFILFTIDDNLTLKEIAHNVYQNGDNWIYLYNYKNNTNKIDRKAAEYNVSVEEIASTPKYLAGVTLQFPTVLIASNDEIKEHSRKVA